jgi:hypothetical protein
MPPTHSNYFGFILSHNPIKIGQHHNIPQIDFGAFQRPVIVPGCLAKNLDKELGASIKVIWSEVSNCYHNAIAITFLLLITGKPPNEIKDSSLKNRDTMQARIGADAGQVVQYRGLN